MIRKKIININYILTEWLFCRLTVDLIKNRIHGFSLSLSTPLSLSQPLSLPVRKTVLYEGTSFVHI